MPCTHRWDSCAAESRRAAQWKTDSQEQRQNLIISQNVGRVSSFRINIRLYTTLRQPISCDSGGGAIREKFAQTEKFPTVIYCNAKCHCTEGQAGRLTDRLLHSVKPVLQSTLKLLSQNLYQEIIPYAGVT